MTVLCYARLTKLRPIFSASAISLAVRLVDHSVPPPRQRRAGIETPALPTPPNADTALLPDNSVNRLDDKLVLEDSDLNTHDDHASKEWASLIAATIHPDDADARADLISRIAVLPDHRDLLEGARDAARLKLAHDPALKEKDAESLRLLLYLFERDDAVRLMRAG